MRGFSGNRDKFVSCTSRKKDIETNGAFKLNLSFNISRDYFYFLRCNVTRLFRGRTAFAWNLPASTHTTGLGFLYVLLRVAR
jgi:hypothetical protein